MAVVFHLYGIYTVFSKNIHKLRANIQSEAKVGKKKHDGGVKGRTGARQALLCAILYREWQT